MHTEPAIVRTAIQSWTSFTWRHAAAVVAFSVLSTCACLAYVATHLGVNLDNNRLLDPDLPFQRAAREFARHFPDIEDSLLVVIDADSPELSRSASAKLVTALEKDAALFRSVYAPASLPFFARNALLYRGQDDLWEFSDRIAQMQPILVDLTSDPSIANLSRLVRLGLEHDRGIDSTQWATVLDKIGDATVEVYREYPVAISWEELMLAGSGIDSETRQTIVAEPVLEFDRFLAADAAISHIRAQAQALDLTPEHGVRVRITGNPALNYDEMYDLGRDVGIGGIISFLLILALLWRALHSLRLVLVVAATLVTGLIWTAAVATAAFGELNVLSVTFGLLFIGLGVDFPLHLTMHFAAARRAGSTPEPAMQRATREVGPSLLLCAVTTAIGFLAFVPTDYRGVGELGVITAAGMFVIVALTLTLCPALVRLIGPITPPAAGSNAALLPAALAARFPRTTVACALGLGITAATMVPRLGFDMDVISLRNPSSESVQAFRDLLADAKSSPWNADIVAPNLDEAERLRRRLSPFAVVGRTVTANDYVPGDQEEKREILSDTAFLFDLPVPADRRPEPPSVAEQIDALRKLHQSLDGIEAGRSESALLEASAMQLRAHLSTFLARIDSGAAPENAQAEADAEAALAELERILLGNFKEQMSRLRAALDPDEVSLETLPPQIRRRFLADDGTARIQVFPKNEFTSSASMERFVDSVRSVAPEASGNAVSLVSFGRATATSMREAMLLAVIAMGILLVVLQRRISDPLLILTPVLLGSLLTAGAMVGLGISFNFANVIVLPLLLGVGVDSGIHLVRRARSSADASEALPGTTARAVFYSAMTTVIGFGGLAFSSHGGVSSMGVLLIIGMLLTLAGNLVVLPALLRLFIRTR